MMRQLDPGLDRISTGFFEMGTSKSYSVDQEDRTVIHASSASFAEGDTVQTWFGGKRNMKRERRQANKLAATLTAWMQSPPR